MSDPLEPSTPPHVPAPAAAAAPAEAVTPPPLPPLPPAPQPPQYAQPPQAPQYAQPQYVQPQYAQPQYAQPPVPPAPQPSPYAAPYVAPRPPAQGIPAPEQPSRSGVLGIVALALGLLATVGSSLVGAIAIWQVALGAGREIASRPMDADFDWSILSPVRDQVLVGETSFWAGTVLGITALVLGIVALVTRRGRIPGMIAVIVAALGPVVYFVAVAVALSSGLPAGSGIGG